MVTKEEIALIFIGGVFVAEVVSVILQVGYFKITHGKRLFRMAPLHHHFELGGMSEQQVVRMFWTVGAILGAAGILIGAL
jgi:phospho-N-acetylmuramoyl-pentapeptide-transferase